tara:strand:- start:894 stop:1355 length:462 start_codon:yes stop_codon:yes gene_type:complete
MKIKKQTIIYLFSILVVSCQTEEKTIKPCNLEINQGIARVDGKIFTGKCNLWYYTDNKDSILLKTLTYKRGDLRNEIAYYTSSGEIEYIGSRYKGQIDGEFVSFYENGIISIEGEIEMGKYIGDWNYYDDDGSLNKIIKYNNDGNIIETVNYK